MVLVTGGGRRLGRAIAEGLAFDGARLAIHYHASSQGAEDLASSLNAGGPIRAQVFRADLTDAGEAARLPARVLEAMGRLDVLINSAAVMLKQPFGSITPEMWDQVLNLNLRAGFFLAQGAAPALRAARGRIVNISDVAAFEPWSSYLPHSISKAGIEMLTRGLARLFAPEVTVNAVAPGPVLLPDDWGSEDADRTARMTPLGRLGSPADVVAAVRFVLQADFATGSTVVVDGGKLIR